jgi:hypothetical protein
MISKLLANILELVKSLQLNRTQMLPFVGLVDEAPRFGGNGTVAQPNCHNSSFRVACSLFIEYRVWQ